MSTLPTSLTALSAQIKDEINFDQNGIANIGQDVVQGMLPATLTPEQYNEAMEFTQNFTEAATLATAEVGAGVINSDMHEVVTTVRFTDHVTSDIYASKDGDNIDVKTSLVTAMPNFDTIRRMAADMTLTEEELA